jgi:hypothetical protein
VRPPPVRSVTTCLMMATTLGTSAVERLPSRSVGGWVGGWVGGREAQPVEVQKWVVILNVFSLYEYRAVTAYDQRGTAEGSATAWGSDGVLAAYLCQQSWCPHLQRHLHRLARQVSIGR